MRVTKPQLQEVQACDWVSIDDLVLSQYRAKLQKRPEFAPTTPLDLWPDSRVPLTSSAHKSAYEASTAGQRNDSPPPVWLW